MFGYATIAWHIFVVCRRHAYSQEKILIMLICFIVLLDRIFPVIHNTDGMDQSGNSTGNGSAGQGTSHTSPPNQGPPTPGAPSSKTPSQASPQT